LSQPGQASFIGENEGLAEASVRLKTSKTQLTKIGMIMADHQNRAFWLDSI
jgi:hypothetical protein